MAKHFRITIAEEEFSYQRKEDNIAREAALDGIYIIRTSLPSEALPAQEVVQAYKQLSAVEQAFRSYKSIDLKVRPIYHHLERRVRVHVLLCMLAYYVEWHMRQALASMLFDEDDPLDAFSKRSSVVAPARRSSSAQTKAQRKRTKDNFPVHSFQTLLKDLATIVKDRVQPRLPGAPAFDKITIPTPVQQQAFQLLGVKL